MVSVIARSTRRSPLGRLHAPGRYGADRKGGPGAHLSLRHPLSIATISAASGKTAGISEVLRSAYGIACPPPGRSASGDERTLHWFAPNQWYAVAEGLEDGSLVRELRRQLGSYAAIADQSHGRVVFGVAGAHARDVLAKGTPVDLHPSVFGPGQCATTQMAHVGVHLACVGTDTFELSLFRGFAESFWEWLCEMSLEFGYDVR